MAKFDPLLGRLRTKDEAIEKIVEKQLEIRGGGGGHIIQAFDQASDDTAPGKLVGIYTLTIDSAWHDYPGGSAFDVQVPASAGDWIQVRISGYASYTAVGAVTDICALAIGANSIDGAGNPIQSWWASAGVATGGGITIHIHDQGEGGFTAIGEHQITAAEIINGLVTIRNRYYAWEIGVGGGTLGLYADEIKNFRLEAEVRKYP